MCPRLSCRLLLFAVAAVVLNSSDLSQLAAQEKNGDRIKPYALNPRYWQYKGQPVMLLGGSKTDHLFLLDDLQPHLDEIHAVGANYVRNTMSQREAKELKPHKLLPDGKFDVDRDGRPSEAEAEFLRSVIIDWGGEVVHGNELPGDLDFLVLGEMPPMPTPLRPDATDAQTRIYVSRRSARLRYEELFRRASEAQIPVLNANRFFVLIGKTDR